MFFATAFLYGNIYLGLKLITLSVTFIIILLALSFIWNHSSSLYIGAVIGTVPFAMAVIINYMIKCLLYQLEALGIYLNDSFLVSAFKTKMFRNSSFSIIVALLLIFALIYFTYTVTHAKPFSIKAICFAVGYNLYFSLFSCFGSMSSIFVFVFIMPILFYIIAAFFSGNQKVFRAINISLFILFTMPAIYALSVYVIYVYNFNGIAISLMCLSLPIIVGLTSIIDHIVGFANSKSSET